MRIARETNICISLDETTTRADLALVWSFFAAPGQTLPDVEALAALDDAWQAR